MFVTLVNKPNGDKPLFIPRLASSAVLQEEEVEKEA